jgi:hypothetical protein
MLFWFSRWGSRRGGGGDPDSSDQSHAERAGRADPRMYLTLPQYKALPPLKNATLPPEPPPCLSSSVSSLSHS